MFVFSPDTDHLVLTCQMWSGATVVIVRPHHIVLGAKVVLGAALRGQVVMLAGVLRHLRIAKHINYSCTGTLHFLSKVP